MRTSRPYTRSVIAGGALLAAIIGYLALQYAAEDARGAYGANRAGCEVTKPQLTVAPGGSRKDYWIAQNGLFVSFGKKMTIGVVPPGERAAPGTIPGSKGRHGWIGAKVPWFRDSRAFGELRVRGICRPGRDRLAKT
jgi:hypothetical protein